MSCKVPRNCTEVSTGDTDQGREKSPRPVEEFRSASAYVLLGDPGSGKTTVFESEHEALEEATCLITARDFLTWDLDSHPEWRHKTLLIDGLDEIRVGSADARTPFDRIRSRLDKLGRPRFRLSCRDADWLGDNDRSRLASVSPDSQVTVLRLDPLTDSDVVRILEGDRDVHDPQAFMGSAREQGIDGLLKNPMSLRSLVDAVAQGDGWPESRLETFEKACSRLVQEHNLEHEVAGQDDAPGQLIDAAGRLCAVHLLAGTAGYTLRHSDADADYPRLHGCGSGSPGMLRQALFTKLFRSTYHHRFTPVHRHIAEFLGARHLSKIILEGLPAGRVLALMTGEDGLVVTEMRGLSAWLAAHCTEARADLIARDPVGVGLYGDIRVFSLGEKRALLKGLGREGARLASTGSTAMPFAALAAPEMEPAVEEVLASSCRSRDHQLLTEFVLRALGQGEALPGLTRALLAVIRDDTWWPRVRTPALDAFIRLQNSEDMACELEELLAEIRAESVSDPTNELLGTLLTQLYPVGVTPPEVWDYLPTTGDPDLVGRCLVFWDRHLLQSSSPGDLAELLDSLVERLTGLWPLLDAHHLSSLPQQLLAAGVEAHGDEIGKERLHDWLGVGLRDEHFWPSDYHGESIFRIRSWLTRHPDMQKKIIEAGLDRCPETGGAGSHALDVLERLYGATPPHDLGLWCLQKAAMLARTKPRLAGHLFERAAWEYNLQGSSGGLSLEALQEQTHRNERFETILNRLLRPQPTDSECAERAGHRGKEHRRKEERWLDDLRANEVALRENRGPAALLHKIAEEYFGRFRNVNLDGGPGAIATLLQGDWELTDATLQALRGVIDRDDVPDADDILGLREKGRSHYLGWPFLAGLAEVERTAPEDPSGWDDVRIRRAVAFYYCAPHASYQPPWYRRLIEARPEIVADVQVRFAASEFRSDREHVYKLWELAHDPYHAGVTRHAALPLLRAFPARCRLTQVRALDHLLWAALQHGDRASFEELIRRKLSRTSLNVAQRVHWLAAGAIVSPGEYRDLLRDFVWGRERRLRHLPAFFCPDDRLGFSFLDLEIPLLELLIRLLGSYAGPDQWSADGSVGPAMRASLLVRGMIERLAATPDQSASASLLETLLVDPALSRWRDLLSQAREAQRTVLRDARFRHPDIEQVCRTLDGGRPANAADLSALVEDNLCELALTIRAGNTDDWRQYWNEDPKTPKHEHLCRDALLSDLRARLPPGVDAQPEGEYARDRRADIRVSCGDFSVPVEIKKNLHQNLWSALRHQLIEQYASAPETDGCGIYLVFWFGKSHTQPHPSSTRPGNPRELQRQLTAILSENEARKISICVIDVSGDSPNPSTPMRRPRSYAREQVAASKLQRVD